MTADDSLRMKKTAFALDRTKSLFLAVLDVLVQAGFTSVLYNHWVVDNLHQTNASFCLESPCTACLPYQLEWQIKITVVTTGLSMSMAGTRGEDVKARGCPTGRTEGSEWSKGFLMAISRRFDDWVDLD